MSRFVRTLAPASAISVGPVDDPLERDADRVARHVVGASVAPATPGVCGQTPGMGGLYAACGAVRVSYSQATESASALRSAPAIVHVALASPGWSLDPQTRDFFEPRLGFDLGAVRIHDDGRAAASARAVAARAYTVGSEIVFGAGEFRQSNREGRALLAHELAHVRQDALAGCPGRLLRRTPCPNCHKPESVVAVTVEDLSDGDWHLLPDEDAAETLTYLRNGLLWGEDHGVKRYRVRAVHYKYYDGSSRIVGYELDFLQAHFSFGDRDMTVTIDVYGNELRRTHTDDAIEPVWSPIDFLGPELLMGRSLVGGARALAGGLAKGATRVGAAVSRTARNFVFSSRIASAEYLGAAMRADFSALASEADFSAVAAEGSARSAFVLREGGSFAGASAQAGRAATEVADRLPVSMRVTGPSFADISSELGLEAPGTIIYRSTAAAATAARAAGLETASRPGFQTHATAPSVRAAFGISGRVWQSVHIVPQVVYRALKGLGMEVSEGRALTTLLPREAHAAFDRTWIREWHDAVAAGRTIRVEDVYNWVSRAINSVDDQVIDAGVKGAINDRLGSELYGLRPADLGLHRGDVIVAGRP